MLVFSEKKMRLRSWEETMVSMWKRRARYSRRYRPSLLFPIVPLCYGDASANFAIASLNACSACLCFSHASSISTIAASVRNFG